MITLVEAQPSYITQKMKKRFTAGPREKIQAIKAIRAATRLGLKEAKDLTDVADNGGVGRIRGEFNRELKNQLAQDLVGTGYEIQ